MRAIRPFPLPSDHPDFPIVTAIETELCKLAKGREALKAQLPQLIRNAIDEVIDTPRTGRVYASELEKTEKTYIGTKVEILIRNFFRLPQGILDLRIAGYDVDVKNTLANTWMIPREATGKPCIVVASDEEERTCFLGILIAKLEHLTAGVNQDQKRSVSAIGHQNIHWLLVNEPYPPSFWSQLGVGKTHSIMRGISGNERVSALFRNVQRQPIHRDIIQAVAQQKDYMKRARANGGARDVLRKEGIAILSGKYNQELIARLSLGTVTRDEQISILPKDPTEAAILVRAKQLDPT